MKPQTEYRAFWEVFVTSAFYNYKACNTKDLPLRGL